jgi:hypothetical protein
MMAGQAQHVPDGMKRPPARFERGEQVQIGAGCRCRSALESRSRGGHRTPSVRAAKVLGLVASGRTIMILSPGSSTGVQKGVVESATSLA